MSGRMSGRMSGIHVGLLLNFNVPRLVDGLHRHVV